MNKNMTKILLVIVLVVVILGCGCSRKQAGSIEELRKEIEEQHQIATYKTIEALIYKSHALFLSHNDLEALLTSVMAGKIAKQTGIPIKLKYQVIAILQEVVYGVHEKNRLEAHTARVHCVTFSPDGMGLASASADDTIKFWHVESGQLMSTFTGHSKDGRNIAFSPDGTRLATAGAEDDTIKLWHVESGQLLTTFTGHDYGRVLSVAFSPDGTKLASGSTNETIKLWDVENGQLVTTFPENVNTTSKDFVGETIPFWITRLTFSPNGTNLLLSSGGLASILLNVADGQPIAPLPANIAEFSPDGTKLALGWWNRIFIINTEDDQLITTLTKFAEWLEIPDNECQRFTTPTKFAQLMEEMFFDKFFTLHMGGWVTDITFSPDGTKLASSSMNGTIKLWHLDPIKYSNDRGPLPDHWQPVTTFTGQHTMPVKSIAFNPDGMMLASGSEDHTIKLWNIADRTSILDTRGWDSWGWNRGRHITSVIFSPDNTMVASGDLSGDVTLWNVADRKRITTLPTEDSASIAFSPDGTTLASGSTDNTIKLWNVADGTLITTFPGHTNNVTSIMFSPDGTKLASGSDDRTIKLWNVENGQLLTTLTGHDDRAISVAFSPDGTTLVSGSIDNTIKLWNVADGTLITTFTGHTNGVTGIMFSPNGTMLASGSMDNTIKLWNVADGTLITTFPGHTDDVKTVKFSPDSTILVSGSADNTIKLWNVSDGSLIDTLKGHSDSVNSVDFNSNGTTLVSGSNDGTIMLWNLDLDDLLLQGCEWLHGYLKNNPNISDEDRTVCDDILAMKDTKKR